MPSGLSNPDNTCFANVCLQSFMSTELEDFFLTKDHFFRNAGEVFCLTAKVMQELTVKMNISQAKEDFVVSIF